MACLRFLPTALCACLLSLVVPGLHKSDGVRVLHKGQEEPLGASVWAVRRRCDRYSCHRDRAPNLGRMDHPCHPVQFTGWSMLSAVGGVAFLALGWPRLFWLRAR